MQRRGATGDVPKVRRGRTAADKPIWCLKTIVQDGLCPAGTIVVQGLYTERSHSGLVRSPGKWVQGQLCRGFKSLPLRHIKNDPPMDRFLYGCYYATMATEQAMFTLQPDQWHWVEKASGAGAGKMSRPEDLTIVTRAVVLGRAPTNLTPAIAGRFIRDLGGFEKLDDHNFQQVGELRIAGQAALRALVLSRWTHMDSGRHKLFSYISQGPEKTR